MLHRTTCLVFIFGVICTTTQSSFIERSKHVNERGKQSFRNVYRRSGPTYDDAPASVTLQTLKNSTFMVCAEAMNLPYARMVQLNDEQMKAWLQERGGNYVQDYMAATEEEANENFPNMLMLTAPITLQGSVSAFSIMDNFLTKQVIMEDLHKLTTFLMNYMNTSQSESSSTTINPAETSTNISSTVHEEHVNITNITRSTDPPTTLSKSHKTTSVQSIILPTTYDVSTVDLEGKSTTTNIPSPINADKKTTTGVLQTTPAVRNMSTRSNIPTVKSHLTDSTTQASVNTDQSLDLPPSTYQKHDDSSVSASSSTIETNTFTPLSPALKSNSTTSSSSLSSMLNSNTATPSSAMLDETSSKRLFTTLRSIPSSTFSSKMTTEDPKVLHGIEELLKYAAGGAPSNNTSRLGARSLDWIWRESNTTLHPSTLLGLVAGARRRKRNADDSISVEEYCQKKGALTDDGKFIHLCSLCAVTTRLPDNVFPRYINEAVCKTGDTECFRVGGTAHGQCKQTRFSLSMLRKKTGQCNMLLYGGETLVFEEWQLVPQMIRVACECTINKLSVFSQYVAPDLPVG